MEPDIKSSIEVLVIEIKDLQTRLAAAEAKVAVLESTVGMLVVNQGSPLSK